MVGNSCDTDQLFVFLGLCQHLDQNGYAAAVDIGITVKL